MKECPYCAEEIQDTAIKCRYCREFLNDDSENDQIKKPEGQPQPQQRPSGFRNLEERPQPQPQPVLQAQPANTTTQVNVSGVGDEIVKASYGMKRYIGKGFLTIFLYYVGFYFTGLIVNIVFLVDANRTKYYTGRSPAGRIFLIIILIFHTVIPALLLLTLMVIGMSISGNFY